MYCIEAPHCCFLKRSRFASPPTSNLIFNGAALHVMKCHLFQVCSCWYWNSEAETFPPEAAIKRDKELCCNAAVGQLRGWLRFKQTWRVEKWCECWFIITSVMTSKLLIWWEGDQTAVCLWEEMIHWGDRGCTISVWAWFPWIEWNLTVTFLDIPGPDDSSVPPASGSLSALFMSPVWDYFTVSNLTKRPMVLFFFFQTFTFALISNGSIIFVFSPWTCCTVRMEMVERQ